MLRLLSVFAVVSALCLPMLARATPPTPLSTDVYGRLPNVDQVTLSPSGELYAYVNVTDGKRQILVKDLSGHLKVVAPMRDEKIRGLIWVGNDHVIIDVSMTQNRIDENLERLESFSLNVRTAKTIIVFANCLLVQPRHYGMIGAAERNERWYGFFIGDTRMAQSQSPYELYRVDLDTGACERIARGLEFMAGWALDAAGAVVAHSEYMESSGKWTLRTGDEGGSLLATFREPLQDISLAGLGRTSGTVLIEKSKPEEWSLTDGSHSPIETDGLVDGFIHDPTTRLLVGALISGDKPHQQFFAPAFKARQAALRKALGAEPFITSWTADFKRLVVYTEGDGDAGTYWLVDGPSAKPLAYSYPDIPDADVGSTRVVVYKASDGLEIHGILTLPPGRIAKNLPLVVMPHGGPQYHDRLGFDWLAQAFAGHGYAVFQPNFRGSDGYGLTFRDAGFGQWGRKMQTDISDGMAELVREGVADPKRACVVGASYGGYAALAGVTIQHGLYRCAVSYAGVSNLHRMFSGDYPAWADQWTAGSRYVLKFMGVQSVDDSLLFSLSPAHLAEHADAPILLIHGEDDSVVPIEQSREMEQRLRQFGKPVELLTIKSEDHWLSRDATRKQMLAAAMAFVEKNNPPD